MKLKCNSHAQNLHVYVSLHIRKYTQVCRKSHKLSYIVFTWILSPVYFSIDISIFLILVKDVYLQFFYNRYFGTADILGVDILAQ